MSTPATTPVTIDLQASASRRQRKARGIFYTPRYIVDYVVQKTVRPIDVQKKTPTVLDPSCGSGWFLLGAYEYLLNTNRATDFESRRRILVNSIFGVDIDPRAVKATRETLLKKLCECNEGYSPRELPELSDNIKCGDALSGFDWRAEFSEIFSAGGFNAIVGNPPYGAKIDPRTARRLLTEFPQGISDTAALFLQRALQMLRPDGRLGFLIPKAFCYASNWRKLREHLLPHLTGVTDLSQAWKEVKLEQCAAFFDAKTSATTYECAARDGNDIVVVGALPKSAVREFGFIVNGVSAAEIKLARKIRSSGMFLGKITQNRRGAMLQKALSRRGHYFALGGKEIQRWQILPDVRKKLHAGNALNAQSRIAKNAVLVQNIVAHIRKPIDHIKITAAIPGAPHKKNCRLLDTVNQLHCRSATEADFVCGLLNSRLLNWYAYRFLFGKAVRTMHFDAISTDQLPLPKKSRAWNRIAALSKKIHACSDGEKSADLSERLDDFVYSAFNLSEAERKTIERAMPAERTTV